MKSNEVTEAPNDPPFWHAPWEFAVHAFVGSFIFGVIALPALGTETAIKHLQEHQTDWVIMLGLKSLGYLVFFTDIMLFIVFLWRTAKRAVKHL